MQPGIFWNDSTLHGVMSMMLTLPLIAPKTPQLLRWKKIYTDDCKEASKGNQIKMEM